MLEKGEKSQKSDGSERFKTSCCYLMWSLLWLFILVFFAWPLSMALAGLYGFVSPFITLVGLDDISDALLQGVNVGRECAQNVRNGKPMC
ncbi:unnamed protein product [Caretta caretta]